MPSLYNAGWPAWIMLAGALALWVVFLRLVTRLLFRSRERVICPLEHRPAKVTFVRAPDGAKEDVISCSILEDPTDVTCSKRCLEPARA